MITKIRLQNWKSFKDSYIYIDSLGILVGTNASGKSNVLDAFVFLRAWAEGKNLTDSIQMVRGGEDWIIRRGEKQFALSVEIENEDQTYLFVLRVEKEDGIFRYGKCEILLENSDDKINGCFVDNSRDITWSLTGLLWSKELIQMILTTLKKMTFLDPIPAKMRDYCKVSREIKSDGSNTAGVLCSLEPREKEKVEKLLSQYVRPLPERDINKVEAVPVGLNKSDAMLYCYEDWNPTQPVDARGMSDGTLRFTAIVVSLLTAKPNSLLLIEEVDNGLHPSRAKELVGMLKELSKMREVDVLCTTHNPVLLDELGNKMIPFVSYVTRDEQGNSHVNLLEDKENLAKLMASGSIGSMMINDRL